MIVGGVEMERERKVSYAEGYRYGVIKSRRLHLEEFLFAKNRLKRKEN